MADLTATVGQTIQVEMRSHPNESKWPVGSVVTWGWANLSEQPGTPPGGVPIGFPSGQRVTTTPSNPNGKINILAKVAGNFLVTATANDALTDLGWGDQQEIVISTPEINGAVIVQV